MMLDATYRLARRVYVCGASEAVVRHRDHPSPVLSIADSNSDGVPFADAAQETLLVRFDDVVEDRSGAVAPRADDVARMLDFGARVLGRGDDLLLHCEAGFSRSAATAFVLLATLAPAEEPSRILSHLAACRRQMWPNLLVVELAAAQTGRDDLLRAVRDYYRLALRHRPAVAASVRARGRDRELAFADWSAG